MIYRYELKKLISITKVHLIFVCAVILCGAFQGIIIENQMKYLGATEEYYNEYMKELEGPVTEEKEQYIQKEKIKIQEAIEKSDEMEQQYMENEISETEYLAFNDEYLYAQSRQESFARVEQVYENIKKNGGWFIYDTYWKSFFSPEIYNSIILLIVIVVFSMYVGNEYQSGMWQYLASSKYGREKTLIAKSIITISGAFFISIVFCLVRFFIFQFVGDIPLKSAPLCSIEGFYHLGNVQKISTFCLKTMILQSIVIAAMAFATMIIAYWFRNGMIAMIVVAGLYFIPFLLKVYSGTIYAFSVTGIINMPEAIKVLEHNNRIIILIPIAILLILILCICGMKRYQRGKLSLRK